MPAVCESREAENPWFGYCQQYDGHELTIFVKIVLLSQYEHGGPMNMWSQDTLASFVELP
jgi:hypothetical protein